MAKHEQDPFKPEIHEPEFFDDLTPYLARIPGPDSDVPGSRIDWDHEKDLQAMCLLLQALGHPVRLPESKWHWMAKSLGYPKSWNGVRQRVKFLMNRATKSLEGKYCEAYGQNACELFTFT